MRIPLIEPLYAVDCLSADHVLQNVSQQLESLETLAGLQSFFLVVDPSDTEHEGFLGGTVKGREFWRGHRGCGVAGAQSFKAQCVRSQAQAAQLPTMLAPAPSPSIAQIIPYSDAPQKKVQAREVKTELYGSMRDALRFASTDTHAHVHHTETMFAERRLAYERLR